MLAGGMPAWFKEPLRYFARLVEEPEEAAATAVLLATTEAGAMTTRSPQLGNYTYWERGVPVPSKCPLPWSPGTSHDEGVWARLWEHSEQLVAGTAPALPGVGAAEAAAVPGRIDGSGLPAVALG